MILNNYKILICNNKSKIKLMVDFFNEFMKLKEEKFVGIDFEFNRDNNERKIALFQINLESKNHKQIFMFYPPHLNDDQMYVLKKLLFSELFILHGGESLDIPYLFSEIFTTTNEKVKFLMNLYDTKFLCEYYNAENNLTDYKCKIYYLLHQMKVVDDKQFKFLLKNEEDMGHISQIFINVNKMSKELTLYSAYDVLYLPRLLNKFPNKELYNNIIPDITRIVLLAKEFEYIEKRLNILNKFNNFYIKTESNIKLFNNYYKDVIESINDEMIIYFISINYFKKFFNLIIKIAVYSYLTNNNKYYYVNKKDTKDIKIPSFEKYIIFFKSFQTGHKFLLHINKIVKDLLS
jgi:hypothetical protein